MFSNSAEELSDAKVHKYSRSQGKLYFGVGLTCLNES
jgi:hypothetical protein